MPMGGEHPVAERPGVRDESDFRRRLEPAAEHVVASGGEFRSGRRWRRISARARLGRGTFAEQPFRLVVACTGLRDEVGAPEEHAPGGQQRTKTAEVRLLRQASHEAIVGVAEHGHVAARCP